MSDKELVKMARLAQRDDRMSTGALYGDLADRIEALTAERDEQIEWVKRLADMQIASEAKLAKAVEALRGLMQHMPDYADTVWQDARTTLAEIEGEKG
jgi:hypothetical protein